MSPVTRHAVWAWALAALVIGAAFAASMTGRIAPQSDLWDYAQEARQLARGDGFTSLYTYPVHLRPGEEPPFPVRWRMPLNAAIGALMLPLGVPLPEGFLYLGALAHALLVGLAWLLAVRITGGSVAAGHIASASTLLCPILLDPYNPGYSQTLAAALGLVVWLMLLRPSSVVSRPSSGSALAALAAIPAAAAWYLRSESAIFLPLWLWAARTWPRRAVFGAVYVALCGVWLLALHAGTGDPAPIQGNPILLYTREYPGYSSSRSFDVHMPGMLEYVAGHPVAFALHFARNLAGYGIGLLSGLGPVAIALAIVGLVLGVERRGREGADAGAPAAARREILPLALVIPWQILAFSTLEWGSRFLVPVIPIACALIGGLAGPVLAERRSRRLLVALTVVLLLERGGTVAFQRADSYRREPPLPAALGEALQPVAAAWPRDAVVLTDVPDWVAWSFDRPALLLPLRRDLERVTRSQRVSAVLLSPRARARNVADGDTAWVAIIEEGASIPGFAGPDRLPGGARLYRRGPAAGQAPATGRQFSRPPGPGGGGSPPP